MRILMKFSQISDDTKRKNEKTSSGAATEMMAGDVKLKTLSPFFVSRALQVKR